MNRSSGPRQFDDADAEGGKYFTDAADRERNNAGRRVLADATAMKNEMLSNLVLWGAEDVKLTGGGRLCVSLLDTPEHGFSTSPCCCFVSPQPRKKAATCRRGVYPIGSEASHSMQQVLYPSQISLARRILLSTFWQTSERYVP
eukprot:COSAG02_NODE_3017_length_7545_cov_4.558286_6_plen_144_part_00